MQGKDNSGACPVPVRKLAKTDNQPASPAQYMIFAAAVQNFCVISKSTILIEGGKQQFGRMAAWIWIGKHGEQAFCLPEFEGARSPVEQWLDIYNFIIALAMQICDAKASMPGSHCRR